METLHFPSFLSTFASSVASKAVNGNIFRESFKSNLSDFESQLRILIQAEAGDCATSSSTGEAAVVTKSVKGASLPTVSGMTPSVSFFSPAESSTPVDVALRNVIASDMTFKADGEAGLDLFRLRKCLSELYLMLISQEKICNIAYDRLFRRSPTISSFGVRG